MTQWWLERIREGDLIELRCTGETHVVTRIHRGVDTGVDGIEVEGDPRIWRPREVERVA